MIIKKIVVGNREEAFVEDRLTPDFNIICSADDNNKGKTILSQSMMYALGNHPVFPGSFPHEQYYHICIIEHKSNEYLFCRKRNQFIVKKSDSIRIFESVSRLRRYIDREIFSLPEIVHKGKVHLVYPELFYQLFFIGQDKKNCSTIINPGLYSKSDFENMIYSYGGVQSIDYDEQYNTDDFKEKIRTLECGLERLVKQHKALDSRDPASKQLYSYGNDVAFQKKYERIDKLNNRITDLRIERNKLLSEQKSAEKLIHELKSLNRNLDSGSLICMDCGSKSITFLAGDKQFEFDISNDEIRKKVLASLTNRIQDCAVEIDDLNRGIEDCQFKLNSAIIEEKISTESIVAFKNNNNLQAIDLEIKTLKNEIERLKSIVDSNELIIRDDKEKKLLMKTKIVSAMNDFYNLIDPDGRLQFEGFFSPSESTFSGSEEMEFYLSKLYSFADYFDHPFPIIIDSFRDGEITSEKELRILEVFNHLPNQKIFTVTLKSEEKGKYLDMDYINSIDYDSNTTSHILNEGDAAEMRKILDSLGLKE